MAFSIEEQEDGTWRWSCSHSSYGAAIGREDTLAEAKIELAIAEAEILENPFPPSVVRVMRAEPEIFAKDWEDPPYG